MFGNTDLEEHIPDEHALIVYIYIYIYTNSRCSTWIALLSSAIDITGSSTDRTVGWFLGCNSNPRYWLLLYEQEEVLVITDFIQQLLMCVHSHAPMLLLLPIHYPQKAQISRRFAVCFSATLKFVGTFHTTGITYQKYLHESSLINSLPFSTHSSACLVDTQPTS
jgi:hypothetical protein